MNTNLKGEVQLFKGNKLVALQQLLEEGAQRARRERPDPIETTQRQAAMSSDVRHRPAGSRGPSPTYKFGDQWVVSDRLLLDVQYAHVGNNFILDFHEDPADATCSRR